MYKREIIHPRFIMSDWQFVEATRGKKIFRHRLTGSHCEEYSLRLSEHEKNLFEQRVNCDSPYIVRVLHFESISNFNSANVFTHYTARVFMEHIRYQLTQNTDPPENYLYGLLEDTLEGFKCIFEEFQPVRVTNSMIFINEEKKIKVWLSPNILENVVKTQRDVSEQTMVSDIFNVFKAFSKCYEDRQPHMNFVQALQYLEFKKRKHIKKVTSLIPPVSHDYAPKPAKDKLWKTAEKFYSKQDMYSPKINLNQFDVGIKESIIFNTKDGLVDSQSMILPQNGDQQYQPLSGYDKKSFGTNADQEDMNDERRHSIVVRIQSARTTSKNLAVHQNFVQLDKNQLHLDLLDAKRSKQAKLQLIQNIMSSQPYDTNVQKICRIYNHALKYDPIMYLELQRAQGKVTKIANKTVFDKIVQLTKKQQKQVKNHIHQFSSNRAIRIKTQDESTLYSEDQKKREERVRKILEAEKAKRVKAMSTKATVNKTSPQPGKAVIEPQPRPTMVQRRQPIKASIIRSQMENLLGPTISTSTPGKSVLPTASYIENKKKDKNKFMKGFKEEVEKLLFD